MSSTTGEPQYQLLEYWAAHPWKKDPSDSVPLPLASETRDSTVDVFFIHPTSHTRKRKKNRANASIDDAWINAKTDYSSILYQASVFNQNARVFAPRYRQAHISAFFRRDTISRNRDFDLAYNDVKKAFLYFLNNWSSRPIIIAAHSQGSMLAQRLLKEFFENKTLYNRLVVAYIPGWPVQKDYFSSLKICVDSFKTGCICSWRTLRKGYVPFYLKNEHGNSYVVNPLNWSTSGEYAPREMNKGSVLRNFNRIILHTTDAQITNGLLYVNKPRFPGSALFVTKNYHIGDINLFYMNIRDDVRRRIGLFWKE